MIEKSRGMDIDEYIKMIQSEKPVEKKREIKQSAKQEDVESMRRLSTNFEENSQEIQPEEKGPAKFQKIMNALKTQI